MKKVLIGMSGGVDSSVAAILLQKEGYEVIGLTFKFTEDFDSSDAVNICDKLNIKLHIIDYCELFKEKIITPFLNDYHRGITPNPCVLCNKEVKINLLYQKMLELNCDYIATGHYAKIIDDKLYVSEDIKKDQTYFLAQVPKHILSKLLLPLEGITKEKVREIARENDLINANRKDSTDVCFITSKFKDYMYKHMNNIPGDIIDIKTNKIIGKHQGLSNYTIGQRKGLNIGGTKDRIYVVKKDMEKNILYIASGNDNIYLNSTSCLVNNFNLLDDQKITKAQARFRYRQPLTNVEIEYIGSNEVIVKYPSGVNAVTPGQACVIYLNNQCLGGGIIQQIITK